MSAKSSIPNRQHARRSPIRVLFVTPELAPWFKSGGLGDVSAALPAALRQDGVDVRILLPAYPQFRKIFGNAKAVTGFLNFGGAFAPARLLSTTTGAPVPLFLIECPDHYQHDGGVYQDAAGRDWSDNHLRFGLLSRFAALLCTDSSPLGWRPHILHCHDWPSGLAPAYLYHAKDSRSRTLITIHNVAFQGIFPATTLRALGLPEQSFAAEGIEYYRKLSFLKAGIYYSDRISTVSPTYAREIQTDEMGHGMGGLLRHRSRDITGILNGIDTEVWDPSRDPFIAERYDHTRLEVKAANKLALRRRLNLDSAADRPLLGVVARLTQQKGLDVLAEIAPQIVDYPAQLVILGSGEARLESAFSQLARRFPRHIAAVIGYDDPLAHLIEAGSDIFLMPSRYEPCGLNQMYSMRYGTPPVVRATGGLSDTVIDCSPHAMANDIATGFIFEELDADSFARSVRRAITAWLDASSWRRLQINGMTRDFGWGNATREYHALYRELRNL